MLVALVSIFNGEPHAKSYLYQTQYLFVEQFHLRLALIRKL